MSYSGARMRAPWYDALAGSLWPARLRIGVRRRAEPSCDPSSTRHAGATLPSRFTSFATPIVHPISPSDDDLVDLTIAPLHVFKCTPGGTRLQWSRAKRSR